MNNDAPNRNGSRGLSVLLALALAAVPAHAAGGEGKRRILTQTAAQYPQLAKQMKVQGDISLLVTVLPNGEVSQVVVVSGHPLLQNAAKAAVSKWIFAPAAEQSQVDVRINFTLP